MFTRVRKAAAVSVVAAVSAASLTACMSDGDSDSGSGDGENSSPIRIGSTEAQESQWQVFQEEAEKEGLNVEVTNFTEYPPVNQAVTDGELDVNQFQHIQYLAEYNVKSDSDLKPFGATSTFPMGIYAQDADTVDEVADAGEVVVPNDSTNGGRAIKVLAAAGLVELKEDDLIAPSPADIDEENSKVTVTPVSAEQTAIAYNDGQVAVINNNYLTNADVTADDAIYKDSPEDADAQPYINVWVTTADQVDDEDYQKLVEIWHSDAVTEAVKNDTAGSAVSSDLSADELQDILADTEQKFRDQGTSDD